MRSLFWRIALLWFVILALAPRPALADQALVVGINTYPNLPTDSQLQGCVNDADDVTGRLRQLGFHVIELSESQAEKASILKALEAEKSSVRPDERFIFYFAGHGAQNQTGGGVILASDSNPVTVSGYISEQDLYAAVAAVPARTRTVLLDSCYSGAMSLSVSKGITKLRPRYFNFFRLSQSKRIFTVDPSRQGAPASGSAGKVCYFEAAQLDQSAWEGAFEGRASGVFTHFLLQRLQSLAQPWSTLQSDVAGDVLQATAYSQSPIVSPGFMATDVFEAPADAAQAHGKSVVAAPHRGEQSLWQTFGEDRTDTGELAITMQPAMAEIPMNSSFTLNVNTQAVSGYLVVMEIDTDGDLDLLYPASRQAQEALPTLRLPANPNLQYSVNETGVERVKAILFHSKQDAQSVLSQFPPAEGDGTPSISVKDAQTHKVSISDKSATPFWTSALSFAVVPPDQD